MRVYLCINKLTPLLKIMMKFGGALFSFTKCAKSKMATKHTQKKTDDQTNRTFVL